jgi:hypothetical protein
LAVIRQKGLRLSPFFLRQVERAHRLALIELGKALFEHGHQDLGFLVAGTGRAAVAVQRLFDGRHVGQRQFGIDDLDVADRIDAAGDVDHVVVGEAAHDVQMASVSRMLARNWLPRPSPFDARRPGRRCRRTRRWPAPRAAA